MAESVPPLPTTPDPRPSQESAPFGVQVYGPDRRLVAVNQAFLDLAGVGPEELPIGTPITAVTDLLHRRGWFGSGKAGEILAAAARDLDPRRPHLLRRRDANDRLLDVRYTPMPDGGSVVTAADVTQAARAEADIHARAGMLEAVLAALPQGVSLFGPDRRVRLINPAYAAIMGEAAARPGETMADLIERRRKSGEYGPGIAGDSYALEAQIDFQRPASRRRTRPDGTTIDVRTRPLPDGGHISVVTDVTLELAAQAEIERRTAMLDLLMAHVNHGLALFDADERLILANRQAEILSGMAPGWLQPGRTRQDIIAHLRARGIYGQGIEADRLARELAGWDPRRVQRLECVRPDGRVIELRRDPLPGGGSIVTTWDITWRREAEAEGRAARESAEAANRAKSSFLANVGHQLRTPLNAVIGFSEAILHEAERLAAEGADPAGRIGEYAQAVQDSGQQLLALINDILDVARIESGAAELVESTIDLATLVGQCWRLIETAARIAQVRLEVALPAAPAAVQGDERRLRQALLSLLSNAVKFTPAGGTARLSVREAPDGALLIAVEDSGIGIAPADLARAFEPFTQLGDAGRRTGGAGLGLFLARAQATAHGGSLELRSTPGVGSIATLRLPPRRVLHSQPPAPISALHRPERS